MITEAVILAGGLGKRLKSVVSDRPKSMALVHQTPFLVYILEYLREQGIKRFIFSVGYKSEFIKNYFQDKYKDIPILYSEENQPLGTGGALLSSFSLINTSNILVLNGDTFFPISIKNMFEQHLTSSADISMAIKKMKDTSRYGTISFNQNFRVIHFHEKHNERKEGFINAGIYILKADAFNHISLPKVFSLEQDFFVPYLHQKKIFAFSAEDYFIDIGIPEDYEKAQKEFPKIEI